MRASWWGHTDVVERLMDKGADVNVGNWVSTQASSACVLWRRQWVWLLARSRTCVWKYMYTARTRPYQYAMLLMLLLPFASCPWHVTCLETAMWVCWCGLATAAYAAGWLDGTDGGKFKRPHTGRQKTPGQGR